MAYLRYKKDKGQAVFQLPVLGANDVALRSFSSMKPVCRCAVHIGAYPFYRLTVQREELRA